MSEKEELIWVEKRFAEKYKILKDDKTKNEERIKVFEEYLNTVKESSKLEYKANLENLEEDLAIYNGLMLKVKQSFEKAKNEQLEASYVLWEKFDKEIPYVKDKVGKIVDALEPLENKLNKINDLLGKIRLWDFDKLIETLERVSSLYGKNKEMMEFLINNFKSEDSKV